MDIKRFLKQIKDTVTSQRVVSPLPEEKSWKGLGQNAVQNILELANSVPQSIVSAVELQKQYGSPSQLLGKNPITYAQLMSSPITGYAEHLSGYNPLNPQGLVNKVYENPVTAALDLLGAAGMKKMIAPNKQALSMGKELKRQTAAARVLKDISPQQAALNEHRTLLEAQLDKATGSARKQIRNAIKQNEELTAKLLMNQEAELTKKLMEAKLTQ